MKEEKYVSFWLTILVVMIGILSVGTAFVVDAIRNIQPTDVSEYMIRQDDRIATHSATIEKKDAKMDELENEIQEDFVLFRMFESRLTREEVNDVWTEWNREVCPQYHDYYYCASAKGSYQ